MRQGLIEYILYQAGWMRQVDYSPRNQPICRPDGKQGVQK